MFTGIIEALGEVTDLQTVGANRVLTISSKIGSELKIDQSVSHNGVCLTVTDLLTKNRYQVTAVEETLNRSNMGTVMVGDQINLERSMIWGGRVDGHLVQGHVDLTGVCTKKEAADGSWIFGFEFDPGKHHLVVEKGSICVNGVSLTCFNTSASTFEVAIIPYTYDHTNFHSLRRGDHVNLEFDIIGKYLHKILENRA